MLLLATGLTAGRATPGEAARTRAAPASPAPADGGGRPTVLIVTETEGFRHGASIAAGLRELRRLGEREDGGFRVVELTHFTGLTSERLAGHGRSSSSRPPARRSSTRRGARACSPRSAAGCRCSPSRSYRAREEFYRLRGPRTPRRGANVLASLDVASVGGRPRGDRPLVWWRREGRGRVFVSLLGHAPETWGTVRHRRLLAGAMRWALTGRR